MALATVASRLLALTILARGEAQDHNLLCVLATWFGGEVPFSLFFSIHFYQFSSTLLSNTYNFLFIWMW